MAIERNLRSQVSKNLVALREKLLEISVMTNDGSRSFSHQTDGSSQVLAGLFFAFLHSSSAF